MKNDRAKKEKQRVRKSGRRSGFTLVELIVTMVILAIVAALTVPAFVGHIDKARAKECEATREALAAKIVSAKLAHDIDGTNVLSDGSGIMVASAGSTFDVQDYIDKSDLKCPSHGAYTYDAGNDEITCSSHPDPVFLNGTGGYNVTVKNDTSTEKETNVPHTPNTSGGADEGITSPVLHIEQLQAEDLSLEEGTVGQLSASAVVKDEKENTHDEIAVTYKWSGNTSLETAEVSESGQVTAKQSGTCQMTVTASAPNVEQSVTKNVTVTVTKKQLKLTPKIKGLPEGGLTLEEGKQAQLTPEVVLVDEEGNEYPANAEVTFTWESNDPGIASADAEGRITGEKSGRCGVTLRATVEGIEGAAEATVDVTVAAGEKKDGIVQGSAKLWAEDRGGNPANIWAQDFNSWLLEKPDSGNYGTWKYEGTDGKVTIDQGSDEYVHGKIDWAPGEVYKISYTPRGGEPQIISLTVGYSFDKFDNQKINLNPSKNNLSVGETVEAANINYQPQADKTTDKVQFEIVNLSGEEMPAELTVTGPYSLKIKALAPGRFKIRAYVKRERYPDEKEIEIFSDEITVGGGNSGQQQNGNPGITGVTFNPSSLSLKANEQQDITVNVQTNGSSDIDWDKISYSFWSENGGCANVNQQSGSNTATVTANWGPSSTRICVKVLYDGQEIGVTGDCYVTVAQEAAEPAEAPTDFKAGENVSFDLTSWDTLKVYLQNSQEIPEGSIFYSSRGKEDWEKAPVIFIAKKNITLPWNDSYAALPIEEYYRQNADCFIRLDISSVKGPSWWAPTGTIVLKDGIYYAAIENVNVDPDNWTEDLMSSKFVQLTPKQG